MTSKTKINERMRKKTNPELAATIFKAKKHSPWMNVAEIISRPARQEPVFNLDEIDSKTKEGDTVIAPGKVLGEGEISKKIRIAAMKFSESAVKKLKAKKCEIISIDEEIKINPKAQGVKIL